MKNKYYTCNKSFFIALISLLTVAIGCSKEKEQSEVGQTGIKLSIKVAGIQGANVIESDSRKKNSSANNRFSSTDYESTVAVASSAHNMDVGFTVDAVAKQIPIGNSLNEKTEKSLLAATQPMTPGFKYRLLIYRNSSPNLWQTMEVTAGQEINIDVAKGDTYRWYAYSYNSTESPPIPANTTNPTVEAPIDKDLLYADGTITIPNTPVGESHTYPIAITFYHKLTQITVRVDGNMLADYANINGLKAIFSEDDYIKSGTFDIKNNSMGNFQTIPTTDIFDFSTANPTNIWEKVFYTADAASLASFKVKVTDLPVTFNSVDPSVADVNLATFSNANIPVPNIEFTYNYTAPAGGQNLVAIAKLSYTLQSRRILHVSSGASYSYAMERNAPWLMINNLNNFGNLPNSIVRMQPYASGQGVWKGGTATDNTANWILNGLTTQILARLNPAVAADKPDIVIIGYAQSTYSTQLQDALVSYVNDGGILILMNEYTTSGLEGLVNKIFNNPTPAITAEALTGAGSMYPLTNVDDRVLNGPFGDVRNKYWGEDASTSVGLENLPSDDVVIYSYGQAANRALDATNGAAVSMFRHKTKNFFYLGDGGLTSYGDLVSWTICPFMYDAATGRPLPKPYGDAYTTPASDPRPNYTIRREDAQNAIIAGNIMLWAGELAEFNGLNPWRYLP
ncbi:MAG: hypothetical protein ACI35V_01345 [Sphingobacterium composti]